MAKSTVNDSLEQMRQDVARATAENERLRKVNEAQTKEIQTLLATSDELRRINQDLRKQNDDLRHQNAQLRETVKQEQAMYAECKQELDRKIKELETTLRRLDAKSL